MIDIDLAIDILIQEREVDIWKINKALKKRNPYKALCKLLHDYTIHRYNSFDKYIFYEKKYYLYNDIDTTKNCPLIKEHRQELETYEWIRLNNNQYLVRPKNSFDEDQV